jgi:hypothetical protein
MNRDERLPFTLAAVLVMPFLLVASALAWLVVRQR